jgi:hypothetical protein
MNNERGPIHEERKERKMEKQRGDKQWVGGSIERGEMKYQENQQQISAL